MTQSDLSRRDLLQSAVQGAASAAWACKARAAVQAAGLQSQDLAVKEVKVYVLKANAINGVSAAEHQIASVVTNSGIEGNYTLASRYFHPNWDNLGWLDYAKGLLPGKSALDFPQFTDQYRSNLGQLSYASAINNCCWDILGKAVHLPVYRILGAYRDRVRAYASSQHLNSVASFVADLQRAKDDGFTAYKIHPPWLADNAVDHELDIEVARAVRKHAGEKYPLLFDRVGGYSRDEAIKVGRVLDELGYISYEDPIPTSDIDGLVELASALDCRSPLVNSSFLPTTFRNTLGAALATLSVSLSIILVASREG